MLNKFIDNEKYNNNSYDYEETKRPVEKKVEIYVASDSEEECDPTELVKELAKPPPSNFIWPPPCEVEKVPIAAPLYVAPPETQHVTAKPSSYRPMIEKKECLTVQSLQKVESQQTSSTEYECLQVDSNINTTSSTVNTTSTSNNSSESEYKMYQTQNNQFTNVFEQTKEVDDEVEKINQKVNVDLRKSPPLIELPKSIKHVEFVEPGQHVGPHEGTYYQLPPSNIPQPTPKGYFTDFHKALITTSEKPYQIFNLAPTPEPKLPSLDYYEKAVRKAQTSETSKEEKETRMIKEIPKFEVKSASKQCKMIRTASPKPIEFMRSNIIDEVHLPDDIVPYFPPPISMIPNEPYETLESYRTKSPFVGALTTVPDRPYTPFGREIMSQLALDLPQDTPKSSFSNALQTAPDDSFRASSLQFEYDSNPVEYTAKVYERIEIETDKEEMLQSSKFTRCSSINRSFLPTIQPWSSASEQVSDNTMTNSVSEFSSRDCKVSESRRCSELNMNNQQQMTCPCDSEKKCCEKMPTKPISDLLKPVHKEEEEFDPYKPQPHAIYPKRQLQPSPFEGMQVKLTNKMTSNLHKPDEIPTYQRKWFNLPTQNPPKTPEPQELRENVPTAFHDWPTSNNNSRRNSISDVNQQFKHGSESNRSSINVKSKISSKPPIPVESSNLNCSQRISVDDRQTRNQEQLEADEAEDEYAEMMFPATKVIQIEGNFPTKGIRKNSLLEANQRQKVQFEKQRELQHELHQQQQKLKNKQKVRQQKEIETVLNECQVKSSNEIIQAEIQQNTKLSHYEMEMEYKRQLELEHQQRQKGQELREQKKREIDHQREMEESRMREIKLREKRERDLQIQALREIEYQKERQQREEEQRRQQEERDYEMQMQQEEMEREIKRQQEQEKREAEKREAIRLFEIRRKEERDRELTRIENELREKREQELHRLEQEIREKREQKQREDREAENRRKQEQKLREEADREQRRLEEKAAEEKRDREMKLQEELRIRHKQEADKKQREEMELFNIEEEKKRQANQPTYSSHTYQFQTVWPPSKPATPAPPPQQHRQIPIIKTDSETELNATKFRFEPLDDNQRRFMAGIRPPSTCYSPATEEKPYPSIPYYQQHLAFYEAEAEHAGIFDPKALSPTPNRSRSPAFGPPPNPLLAFVNKTRDPVLDESGIYLCGERLLSPIWYDKQHKQMPSSVQRKIHAGGSSSRPPSKPDLHALGEALKKHKQESGSKPPPPPPPMPKQRPKVSDENNKNENVPNESTNIASALPPPKDIVDTIPKGIVANQIRRLSGDSNSFSSFPIRSSLTELPSKTFPINERDEAKLSRPIDTHDNRTLTRQTVTSASFPSHQVIDNQSPNSFHQHFMGQSLALASSQNSSFNQNSVDNVRVSTGSVGTPGALPKHGKTFTTSGPNRGQGILTQPSTGRVPICGACGSQVRSVMAINKDSHKATDLLMESVERLNINTQNSEFRKNASNVIAAMLEARVKQQKLPSIPSKNVADNAMKKVNDPEFLPPPPPPPITSHPKYSSSNGHTIEFNSCDQDLPLPPPPSPHKIPASILTPPLSSDENDLPQKSIEKVQNNVNNNNEKVNYRNKKHHVNGNNNQSSDLYNAPSAFNTNKPELSTHARDRRSYIEKNNNEISSMNGNVVEDELDVAQIANGIANGQHPDHLLPPWDVHGVQHISCVSTQVANENLLTLDLLKRKVTCIANTVSSNFWHLHAQNVMEKLRQGDCLNAIGKKFHPECFKCTYCGKLFGNSPFFLEDGAAYCEADWNELFTTKCFSCGFPVEAGDRWVEALNNNYHSQCFNCTYCKKNLEGQSFFAKGGRPFCKNHAR
ncbi:CLUMA_CG008541, isoform F [Clunio marinus]|uniref:CLUMA_CG008541, isoform F n=1 Tax=Clunio marinus TaxID=568069 RepID=A0A1J1I3Z6_9DIPT|nr:CLUMA_CG008541, isoform F [Clunio marinus]